MCSPKPQNRLLWLDLTKVDNGLSVVAKEPIAKCYRRVSPILCRLYKPRRRGSTYVDMNKNRPPLGRDENSFSTIPLWSAMSHTPHAELPKWTDPILKQRVLLFNRGGKGICLSKKMEGVPPAILDKPFETWTSLKHMRPPGPHTVSASGVEL